VRVVRFAEVGGGPAHTNSNQYGLTIGLSTILWRVVAARDFLDRYPHLPRWQPQRLAEYLGVEVASVPVLVELRNAAVGHRRAEQRYRTALAAAVEALETEGRTDTYTVVAKVAGVSRQAVRQLVLRELTRR